MVWSLQSTSVESLRRLWGELSICQYVPVSRPLPQSCRSRLDTLRLPQPGCVLNLYLPLTLFCPSSNVHSAKSTLVAAAMYVCLHTSPSGSSYVAHSSPIVSFRAVARAVLCPKRDFTDTSAVLTYLGSPSHSIPNRKRLIAYYYYLILRVSGSPCRQWQAQWPMAMSNPCGLLPIAILRYIYPASLAPD